MAVKILEEQGCTVDEKAIEAAESIKKATLDVVLKADGIGSLAALQQIVNGLNMRTNDARIRILHSGVGGVVKSDLEFLSETKTGAIFAFNIGFADAAAKTLANHKKVDVKSESVVYKLEDEMVLSIISNI